MTRSRVGGGTDPGPEARDPIPTEATGPIAVRWGQVGFLAGLISTIATLVAGAVLVWANLDNRIARLEAAYPVTTQDCAQARDWARECRVNVQLIADRLGVKPVETPR